MSGSSSKMSVTQLTLLTALNMMGSGIIMLPTKLAEVGTFSIVSWLVTAGGSTALAYAFAKCGMLSRNRGGMGGYAEYAFGKSGSFLANYAYCVSLLIANIAIAISAVGYAVALFGLNSRNFRSSALRVIEAQKTDGLACLRSAPLYPNVVFASTSGGDPSFLKKLTMALLNQPPSHKGFSWGAAGDFVGVDQLYRSLKLGPYAYLRELNWQAVREEYLPHLLGFAGLIAALLIHSVYTKILVNVRTRQLRETLARQLDLEKEARISRTRLSQMERAGIVSQLSGMLAHEMLQPVTSILNFAGGLRMCVNQRFQEDPAICRASEAISEEAHRIAAIVERVRSYAKDEDSPRICLKASTALEAALKTFQHSSTSEEVRTRVVIKHNPLIEVNKLEIELVLFNLMKNSAAAMADAPSKQLDLSIDQQNNKVIFSIRDFGPQLSEAVFAHLTEPLTSMKKDGLGLGLSLAKAIVERHGGRISFTRFADGLCAEVILPTAATGLEDQTVLSTRQE